jgi:hypothetical protein
MSLKMNNNISILTFNRQYNDVYSIIKSSSEFYGKDYILDSAKAEKYLLEHYAVGYTNFGSLSKSTGLLPPGVKAIFPNVVVFERPPTYQNIFYIPDTVSERMSEEVQVYRIALPWQLYIAVYNSDYYLSNVHMYFMDGPLTSVDQNIYAPNIPNFFANGLLCRPNFDTMEEVERYSKDISGIVHSAFDWVWNNGTNHDLTESMVLLPRYTEDISATVIGQLEESARYLNKSFTHSYRLTPDQVHISFKSWEKIDIKDILNYKWVSPSKQLHDQPENQTNSYDWIMGTDAYMENLADFLFNYYDDESDDDIQCRIENEEYDNSAYITHLIQNSLVIVPPNERSNVTYSEMLRRIFTENNTLRKRTVNTATDLERIHKIYNYGS